MTVMLGYVGLFAMHVLQLYSTISRWSSHHFQCLQVHIDLSSPAVYYSSIMHSSK